MKQDMYMKGPYVDRKAAKRTLMQLSEELSEKNFSLCIEATEKFLGEVVVFERCYDTLWEELNIMEEQLRALRRRIRDFKPLPESTWRSVESDLPEEHEEVLVAIRATYRNGDPYYMEDVGCYAYGKWHVLSNRLSGDNRVTHWTPLPSTEELEEDDKVSRAECNG